MDEIAAAATVGKGTVYRAFGNRGRLAEALVDDAERTLQAEVLGGDPPLGPGGPARERLRAFAERYLSFLADNTDLLIETDHHTPGGRFATGAYAFWRAHLAALAREIGNPHALLTAELVLAVLAADLYDHLRQRNEISTSDARARIVEAVESIAGR